MTEHVIQNARYMFAGSPSLTQRMILRFVSFSGGGSGQQGAGDGGIGFVDGEGAPAAETRHKERGGGFAGYPTGKNGHSSKAVPL